MSELDVIVARLKQLEGRFYGKYRGFVVDNLDPQRRGRVRCRVPSVLGDVVTGWAEPCFRYGGTKDLGSFHVPPLTTDDDGNPTTGVWIEFEGGDPQFPIWVGTFYGRPGGESEAPGDDAEADVDVHVDRTYAGHSITAVDTPGAERLELRDVAGQRLTFSASLSEQVKRDERGSKVTETMDVQYSDLVGSTSTIEVKDFAGNTVLLDSTEGAPTVRVTNTDRDGNVVQTIELNGSSSSPSITISDANENVVTMDKDGIRIEAGAHGDTIVMNSSGIQEDASEINLNSGTKGAARLDDKVKSTAAEDSEYWTWVTTLMSWLSSHVHTGNLGYPTSPPVVPYPGTVPSKCIGKIIESSDTVIIGD